VKRIVSQVWGQLWNWSGDQTVAGEKYHNERKSYTYISLGLILWKHPFRCGRVGHERGKEPIQESHPKREREFELRLLGRHKEEKGFLAEQ
jgi:hypothetical protein